MTLRHKDSSLNNRTVDIKCALVKPDLPLPSYSQHEEIPMTCLGSYGAIQGNTKPLSANFKWNPKKSISKELTYFQDDKNLPAGIKLILDPIQKNGSGTIKAQTDGLDGHVHIFGQSKGRLDLSITYISAWDNRQFQFTCLPEHVWKETAEQWKKNN